jgi:hypothetical protein
MNEASRCAARAVLGLARRTVERCATNRDSSRYNYGKEKESTPLTDIVPLFGTTSSRKKNSPLVGGFFSFIRRVFSSKKGLFMLVFGHDFAQASLR